MPIETPTRNAEGNQRPSVTRSCRDRPPTSYPKELIVDEPESEDEEAISLFPNDLSQVRQLQRHDKRTVENFRCEGAESPSPNMSSPFVERMRDNLPLNSSNEVATSVSSPPVSDSSTSEGRPRRLTREHRRPLRFQYYGFGQPAYLRPVFSNRGGARNFPTEGLELPTGGLK